MKCISYYFRATRIQAELPPRQATIRIEPEGISFVTSDYSSTMKWSLIKQVWKFPDVLLVFAFGKWNYTAIPVAPLGNEARQFIEDKVREHGGKVSGPGREAAAQCDLPLAGAPRRSAGVAKRGYGGGCR